MAVQREAENYKKNINATINSGVAAVWTGLAIRCPVTSEISVKRELGIFISVMRYFHFLKSVIRAQDHPLFPPLLRFTQFALRALQPVDDDHKISSNVFF